MMTLSQGVDILVELSFSPEQERGKGKGVSWETVVSSTVS